MGDSLLSSRKIRSWGREHKDKKGNYGLKTTYHRKRKKATWSTASGEAHGAYTARKRTRPPVSAISHCDKVRRDKHLKEQTAQCAETEHRDEGMVGQSCPSHSSQKTKTSEGWCVCQRNTLQSPNFWDLTVATRAALLIVQAAMSPESRGRSSQSSHLLTALWAEIKPSACDAFGGALHIQAVIASNQLNRQEKISLHYADGQVGREADTNKFKPKIKFAFQSNQAYW